MLDASLIASFDKIYSTDLVYAKDCWQLCGNGHCCNFTRYKSQFTMIGKSHYQELPLLPNEYEYLQHKGYRIIPVNPNEEMVLGESSYTSLADVPERIDLVDVFRRPECVPAIVDEVIRLKIPAVWLQEGVVHPAAANKARQAGVLVVMDRCIFKEHRARGL